MSRKLRVAFDVQGTLEGCNQLKVRALFKWFVSNGCEMTIWSHGIYQWRLSKNLSEFLGVEIDAMDKKMASEMDEPFDIAVDDDSSQTYLGAKNFIWVHDIPEEPSEFNNKFSHLITGEENG